MWKYTDKLNGEIISGNRQAIAEFLNIHTDVYDDDEWEKIVGEYNLEEV